MPDTTVANKKFTFTVQQLVIIVVFIVGVIANWFNSYLEYKLLHIEVQELREDLDYERERNERKFKRIEDDKRVIN